VWEKDKKCTQIISSKIWTEETTWKITGLGKGKVLPRTGHEGPEGEV
jgi:hypothetical protein